MDYRRLSLWLDTCGDDLTSRAPLDGDLDVDVAVIGAGYTGLWAAYYLAVADPGLRIAVLEREIAGFGASGRNGGWCSALFAAGREAIARRAGPVAADALARAMVDTVGEIGRITAAEGIDCHYARGGTLSLATSPAQVARVRSAATSDVDGQWLDADTTGRRIAVPGVRGAAFTPHCARIQPARLVRGLARAVERRGVRVFERTAVTGVDTGPGGPAVRTRTGTVHAGTVVRATEAYTAELPGQRRVLAPVYSLLIATEPLPPAFWSEVGWAGRETVTDGRHLLVYAQRTADDRIAFGGRGAPYHWGSRIRPGFDRDAGVFAHLERELRRLFPAARDATITHRWGGPLGVPRDWFPSVGLDRRSGLAWAGGYVGDGVGTSNLAGRTLADLITGADSDLVRLPWVGHRSRHWEPEPARWLGVNAARLVATAADAIELRTHRPTHLGLLDRLTGH